MLVRLNCIELPEGSEIVTRSCWKGFDKVLRRFSLDVNPDYIMMVSNYKLKLEDSPGVSSDSYSCCLVTMSNGKEIMVDYPSREEMYMKINLRDGHVF